MTKKIGAAIFTELAPVDVRSTTFTGSAIDIKDYDDDIELIQYSDAASTGDTLDGKIQESADGSTGWTDITGAAFTQVTAAAAGFESINIKSSAQKRYIRYVGTLAGATISFPFGCCMVAFKKEY